jgi:two-component system, NtrC family, sensor kinase
VNGPQPPTPDVDTSSTVPLSGAAAADVGATGEDELTARVNAARLATLGMLMAGVTHELNTPLGALGSNHDSLKRALARLHEILADDVVEPSELEEVRRIVRTLNGIMRVNDLAMQRVGELVASLRSFGRPDRADIDTIDVREGLDTAVTLLRHELGGRITVAREYCDIPPVQCYPQQLNQVFMNLLLNAIQSIQGAGTVTIRTEAVQDGITVSITDTGVGIGAEQLRSIFEPGFTTKGARVGMGLGLAITRQNVDRHGGRIEVRSQPGTGTTFIVRLPLVLPAAARPS